jgi:nicotinate-nucleotide pyrophosphorylase (carboxylating)
MYNFELIKDDLNHFLKEDIGHYDLTSTILIDENINGIFSINARENLILSGIDVAIYLFKKCEPKCSTEVFSQDSQQLSAGDVIATISGPARNILTAERTALNLLQHMSGISTQTARYVTEISGTNAQLIDTRKTTPGLRILEKHAVICGGGRNHRLGLDNGLLIKDNHIAVCGGLEKAIKKAKEDVPVLVKVEVECDRLDQVAEALQAGADMLLLDNMDLASLTEAVKMVNHQIPLEASGGVTLETIGDIARTGVDFISVGRITQSSPAVDIGLDEQL